MSQPKTSLASLSIAFAAALLAGCDGNDPRARGTSDFVSQVPGSGGRSGPTGAPETDAGKGTGAPPPGSMPRLIEEGDVVKVVGTTLYVLNQYRGLQVVDLSDVDRPRLVSRVPLYGRPLEMYVRDGNAYALVSDYWTYWRCIDCEGGAGSFHGSQLAVIDVSNPAAATLRSKIDIEGLVTDSRIVGDVLYTVSNRYAWWYWADKSDDTKDLTFVQSVNIADPAAPAVVDRLDFPREGWENHIHVTDKLLYVASSAYGRWDGTGECNAVAGTYEPCTRITAVDIASPAGSIVEGKTIVMAGFVQDRWSIDWYDGTLRVLSGQGWSSVNPPKLRTFSAKDATQIDALAAAPIILPRPESVTATRFDGPRAFVVTFERIDPLWTIDISNPASPFVAGHLETPGWLDFIEPRGDRLIALGHDRANDTDPWSLQVSLYDVADLAKPSMIARHPFGEGWGWIPGERDDFRKVFRVLDQLGMILVPFQAWVPSTDRDGWWGGHYRGGVQILDFTRDTLTKRGFVEHPGWVERALPYGERILTVSNELMQVVDARDRDRPALTGSVELARNVSDIAVSGGVGVELAGDWYKGDTKIYVVPANDPDTTTPQAKITIPAPYGRIFTGAGNAAVVSTDYRSMSTRVDVVHVGDGTAVTRRGSLLLPFAASYWGHGGYYYDWWGGGVGSVTQVGPTTLVLHTIRSYGGGCDPTRGDSLGGPGGCSAAPRAPDADFYVIDVRDADNPVVASKVTVDGADWVTGGGADGSILYATHYEIIQRPDPAVGGYTTVRYFLDRIDLTDPANPSVLDKVNVPGTFLAARGDFVYTLEPEYDMTTGKVRTTVHALYLSPIHGKAFLQSSVLLQGTYLSSLEVDGATASTVIDGHLVLVDLADPSNLHVASSTLIPGLRRYSSGGGGVVTPGGGASTPDTGSYTYDWAWVREAEAGHAFVALSSGIVVYDVRDPTMPVLERYVRTQGWVQEIRVGEGRAYLPSGYYGVDTIPLGTSPL